MGDIPETPSMVVTYSDRDLAASIEAGSRGLDTECTVRHTGKGEGKLIGTASRVA